MDANAIATWIASTAAGVSGMVGASSTPLDTIPNTPYAVVGDPKITIVPGSWERVHLAYPMRVYVGRMAGAGRDATTVRSLINGLIAAFRLGGTESGTVASSLLTDLDTNLFEDLGGTSYRVMDGTVEVVVNSGSGYTA